MLPDTHWYPGRTNDPNAHWPTETQNKEQSVDVALAVSSLMDSIYIKEIRYFLSEADDEVFLHLARFLQKKDYTGAGVNLYAILQDEATEYAERRMLQGKRIDQVWEAL
jgi:hypothetical protein